MKRSAFRHLDRQRVRWAEVDMQKIVFNGHYLTYVDTAVGSYWRALALPYQDTMQALGGDLFVRKATLEYHASAEYDDALEVGVRCAHIGNSSMRFVSGVFRGEDLLVSAELVYVYADPVARRAQAVPPALRGVLDGFERGESMVDVRLGTWTSLGTEAAAIRQRVFVEEQHIPAEMAGDAADDGAVHAIACNRLGVPLGAGRLLSQAPGVAKVGRMAVLRPVRGSQVGRALLDALLAAAQARGDREVMLHAQVSAEGFYRRAGFEARGPRFVEAGIEHQEMVRRLA